jgi:hypothetical protein
MEKEDPQRNENEEQKQKPNLFSPSLVKTPSFWNPNV